MNWKGELKGWTEWMKGKNKMKGSRTYEILTLI